MTHSEHHWRDEVWNALTHGLGLLLSVVGSAVLLTLVAAGDGSAGQLAGALVFCIGLVMVYLSSTLYHAIPHLATKRRMKVFDHCAIFVLIAGTYTPFTLVSLHGTLGWWLFAVAWTLALAGVIFKLFLTGRYKGISTIIYIAMGWMVILAIKPMLERVPMAQLLWLLAGGIAYTLGTLFYMSKRRHAHAIWHGFVLLGSACHFVAVSMQVLGEAPVELARAG